MIDGIEIILMDLIYCSVVVILYIWLTDLACCDWSIPGP